MRQTFPIKPSETLLGFVSRYAVFRGVRCADFMRHTGISLYRYASFERALQKLADITGNRPEALAHHALRLENGGFHRLGGETVLRNDVYRKSARYCPKCVVEDHSIGGSRPFTNVFCRVSWMVELLTVCPIHRVPIMCSPELYHSYANEDFNGTIVDRWKAVLRETDEATDTEASGFDIYFNARLNGKPRESEVLDTLPCHGALGVCEVVGAMELRGDLVGRAKMSAEERREAFIHGFDLLKGGYPALGAFLRKRDHRRRETDDKGVGKQLYGILYTYLHAHRDDASFSEIIAFVKDHAFSAHPLGPENNFLGGGGVRKFHSIRSASIQYGIHPATLRKALRAAGLLEPDSDLRDLKVSIAAGALEALAERRKDGVPVQYLRKRLGTTPQVIRQLTEAGLLAATNREAEHKLKSFYSSTQVEDFVLALERRAEGGSPAGMVSLKNCAPFMNYAEIVRNILDGKLRLRISKVDGSETMLPDLRVDENEVRALAGIGIPEGHYQTNDVTARLALRVADLDVLERSGLLQTTLYRGPNGVATKAYTKCSVNAFTKEFISFRKLARVRENREKTERRVAGASPVFHFNDVDRVYRKADVGL